MDNTPKDLSDGIANRLFAIVIHFQHLLKPSETIPHTFKLLNQSG